MTKTPPDVLVSNWNFARDFPQLDETQVNRPHLLETIADILQTIPLVYLEGDEGDGATTTLAQFCVRYPEQTFSLFIRPASRFSYSPDYLRLILAEQFYWYVASRSFEKSSIDQSEFDALIHKVRKKKRNQLLYIVVDGLHQIPAEDCAKVEEIFKEVLPIGVENFRFLIVGQQSQFQKINVRVQSKPYQQLKFQLEDTEDFLRDLGLPKEQMHEIHKVCKSVPGRIASVKRLLRTGINLDDVLRKEPTKYLEFIKLEFSVLDALEDSQRLVLAVITYAKRTMHQNDLQEMCSITVEDVKNLVQKCTFLKSESSGHVVYLSESHRRHAEKALESYQTRALSLQVEFLLHHPTSENAVMFLPTYYQQLNKQQAIIDLISPAHYLKLLETTQSISALRNRAELAVRSASQLRASTEIFKFSLQRGIFIAVSTQKARESEVSALVALNQTDKALALANRAVIKDERLALLATYCKGVKKKSGNLDASLIKHIKDLSADIDFTENPNRAVEIASDIVLFDADLALEIVEKANKRSTNPREQDAAFARLSVTATLGNAAVGTNLDGRTGKLISDASLQKFTASLVAFTEHMPMSEVIQMAEQMDVSHRIYFLKSVIDVRSRDNGVLILVDYALDVLIKDTSYVPKSRDLAELSKPLAVVSAEEKRTQQLIERFEAQLGLIANTAFSKDIALLQMRLARAQMSYKPINAIERITQAYYDAATVKTPEAQAECFVILLNQLDTLDKDGSIEQAHGFRAVIRNELQEVIRQILDHTADHFEAISGALSALARNDISSAFDVAASLNVQIRRDKAFGLIARTFVTLEYNDERRTAVFKAIGKISDPIVKEHIIRSIYVAAERNTSAKREWIKNLRPLPLMIGSRDISAACKVIELRVLGLVDATENSKEIDALVDSINQVDNRSAAIDLCFEACAAVEAVPNASVRLFELGQRLKNDVDLSSEGGLEILERCIYLLSRTFFGQIKFGIFDEDKLIRFASMVELVPCSYSQIEIFVDLAARAWSAKNTDLNKRIILERCLPIADAVKRSGDQTLYEKMCRLLFPVMFTFNSSLAFDCLKSISSSMQEDALYEAALLLIRKVAPTEPYYTMEFDKFLLDGSEIHDFYQILEKHKTDSGFYGTLTAAIDAITSKANKTKFSVQQKTDFAVKCEHLIAQLLPDKLNIQHIGYKVAALGQVYRLMDKNHQQWTALIADASSISNVADRGYVYLDLAKCIPHKYDTDRKRLFADALAAFDQIPSPLDRLSHYEGYASATSRDSASSAKETIKRAIVLSTEIENNGKAEKHRRQLIDIADRIEPGLADQLIELIDDDPARMQCKAEIKKSAELAKIKRDMANASAVSQVDKVPVHHVSIAAWKNFAQLVAGRLQPKAPEVMLEYLLQTKGCSLADSYGMLTWYIENLNRRLSRRQDVEAQVSPLVEALLLSTELAVMVLRQSASKSDTAISDIVSPSGIYIVKPGDRNEALDYIKNWLESNADEYIKFCDPYFGPEDLTFLNLVLAAAPVCQVAILTSMGHLKEINARAADIFEEEWRKISDQNPPDTEIIAIGTEGDERSLFHDRWLITKNSGLRIGTSFNSLGMNKVSEISEMDSAQALSHENNLDRFYSRQKNIDGRRFSYWQFGV